MADRANLRVVVRPEKNSISSRKLADNEFRLARKIGDEKKISEDSQQIISNVSLNNNKRGAFT